MSTPGAVQRVIIDGDLEIVTKPSLTGSTLGRIVFTDKTYGDIGSFKVYGFTQSYFRLINDASRIGRGISFRTYYTQGSPEEGGQNYLYTMDVQNNYIRLGNYTYVEPLSYRYPTGDYPGLLFRVVKNSATASYVASNDCIATFETGTLLPNQSQSIRVGTSSGYGTSVGYRNDIASPYGFIGVTSGNIFGVTECIKLLSTGSVTIPSLTTTTLTSTSLTTNTLTATGDVNFDSPTFSVNSTLNRVDVVGTFDVTGGSTFNGYTTINGCQFTPSKQIIGNQHQLLINQVVIYTDLLFSPNYQSLTASITDPEGVKTAPPGSLHMSQTGSVWVKQSGTGNTGWQKLSTGGTPDLDPITLDPTNNRVGINNPSPGTSLDVTGTINSTGGFFQQNGVKLFEAVTTIKALPPNLLSIGTPVHSAQLMGNSTYQVDIRWGFTYSMAEHDFFELVFSENSAQYDITINTNTSGYYGFYEKFWGTTQAGNNTFRNLSFIIKTDKNSSGPAPWTLGIKPSTTISLTSPRNMNFTLTCLCSAGSTNPGP